MEFGSQSIVRAVSGAERGIRGDMAKYHGNTKAYTSGEAPRESKAAKTFVQFFDSISFDLDAFVYFVSRQRDEISVRVFKFVIGIINEWADCYANEGVTKGTEMYRICKWSNDVLTANPNSPKS